MHGRFQRQECLLWNIRVRRDNWCEIASVAPWSERIPLTLQFIPSGQTDQNAFVKWHLLPDRLQIDWPQERRTGEGQAKQESTLRIWHSQRKQQDCVAELVWNAGKCALADQYWFSFWWRSRFSTALNACGSRDSVGISAQFQLISSKWIDERRELLIGDLCKCKL